METAVHHGSVVVRKKVHQLYTSFKVHYGYSVVHSIGIQICLTFRATIPRRPGTHRRADYGGWRIMADYRAVIGPLTKTWRRTIKVHDCVEASAWLLRERRTIIGPLVVHRLHQNLYCFLQVREYINLILERQVFHNIHSKLANIVYSSLKDASLSVTLIRRDLLQETYLIRNPCWIMLWFVMILQNPSWIEMNWFVFLISHWRPSE